jgi:arabinan endo-1,5-alpha-L-arabinosidase
MKTCLIFTLLLMMGSFSVLAQDATSEAGVYTNPVLDRDFPDPDVVQVDDTYYAYATNTPGYNIQVARSTDLVEWEFLGDALPDLPDWAVQEFGSSWAPEVFAVTDEDGETTYVMYHVARFQVDDWGPQCIAVSTSESPEGPFVQASDEPLVCQRDEGGSIDPASFVDEDGSRYALWKNDGNAVGSQTWLYIQPVSDDALALEDEPVRLIRADQPWEGVLVEAPTLWLHDDRYYLFYSANAYDSPRYGTGYAVADEILGPYEKPERRALLETSIPEGIVGPGGQDIVLDDEGDTWLLYHQWMPGSYRAMSLAELTWEDGTPVVTPTRAAMPVP